MDDGFPLLEEFQDEHALERQLESLLDDASHHLPVSNETAIHLLIYFVIFHLSHALDILIEVPNQIVMSSSFLFIYKVL